MRETEVSVPAGDGLAIAGTLALPRGEGPYPAMVLLSPGRLDREGDSGRSRLALGRPLAAALAEKGVASFRYDRRGVGATPGDARLTGFHQHREDAAAVLRAITARPEVSVAGAIGYSEAALHAVWLGAHAGAAAVVMLAGPATDGEQVYLRWAERLGKDQVPWAYQAVLRLLGRTPRSEVARFLTKAKQSTGDYIRLYGFRVGAPMWREYLTYDPREDLAAVRVPLLAVTGTNDFSVDHRDLDVIAGLVPGPVETRHVPDLTHLLRRDPRPATGRSYREQARRPVDAELLEDVAAWSAANLGG